MKIARVVVAIFILPLLPQSYAGNCGVKIENLSKTPGKLNIALQWIDTIIKLAVQMPLEDGLATTTSLNLPITEILQVFDYIKCLSAAKEQADVAIISQLKFTSVVRNLTTALDSATVAFCHHIDVLMEKPFCQPKHATSTLGSWKSTIDGNGPFALQEGNKSLAFASAFLNDRAYRQVQNLNQSIADNCAKQAPWALAQADTGLESLLNVNDCTVAKRDCFATRELIACANLFVFTSVLANAGCSVTVGRNINIESRDEQIRNVQIVTEKIVSVCTQLPQPTSTSGPQTLSSSGVSDSSTGTVFTSFEITSSDRSSPVTKTISPTVTISSISSVRTSAVTSTTAIAETQTTITQYPVFPTFPSETIAPTNESTSGPIFKYTEQSEIDIYRATPLPEEVGKMVYTRIAHTDLVSLQKRIDPAQEKLATLIGESQFYCHVGLLCTKSFAIDTMGILSDSILAKALEYTARLHWVNPTTIEPPDEVNFTVSASRYLQTVQAFMDQSIADTSPPTHQAIRHLKEDTATKIAAVIRNITDFFKIMPNDPANPSSSNSTPPSKGLVDACRDLARPNSLFDFYVYVNDENRHHDEFSRKLYESAAGNSTMLLTSWQTIATEIHRHAFALEFCATVLSSGNVSIILNEKRKNQHVSAQIENAFLAAEKYFSLQAAKKAIDNGVNELLNLTNGLIPWEGWRFPCRFAERCLHYADAVFHPYDQSLIQSAYNSLTLAFAHRELEANATELFNVIVDLNAKLASLIGAIPQGEEQTIIDTVNFGVANYSAKILAAAYDYLALSRQSHGQIHSEGLALIGICANFSEVVRKVQDYDSTEKTSQDLADKVGNDKETLFRVYLSTLQSLHTLLFTQPFCAGFNPRASNASVFDKLNEMVELGVRFSNLYLVGTQKHVHEFHIDRPNNYSADQFKEITDAMAKAQENLPRACTSHMLCLKQSANKLFGPIESSNVVTGYEMLARARDEEFEKYRDNAIRSPLLGKFPAEQLEMLRQLLNPPRGVSLKALIKATWTFGLSEFLPTARQFVKYMRAWPYSIEGLETSLQADPNARKPIEMYGKTIDIPLAKIKRAKTKMWAVCDKLVSDTTQKLRVIINSLSPLNDSMKEYFRDLNRTQLMWLWLVISGAQHLKQFEIEWCARIQANDTRPEYINAQKAEGVEVYKQLEFLFFQAEAFFIDQADALIVNAELQSILHAISLAQAEANIQMNDMQNFGKNNDSCAFVRTCATTLAQKLLGPFSGDSLARRAFSVADHLSQMKQDRTSDVHNLTETFEKHASTVSSLFPVGDFANIKSLSGGLLNEIHTFNTQIFGLGAKALAEVRGFIAEGIPPSKYEKQGDARKSLVESCKTMANQTWLERLNGTALTPEQLATDVVYNHSQFLKFWIGLASHLHGFLAAGDICERFGGFANSKGSMVNYTNFVMVRMQNELIRPIERVIVEHSWGTALHSKESIAAILEQLATKSDAAFASIHDGYSKVCMPKTTCIVQLSAFIYGNFNESLVVSAMRTHFQLSARTEEPLRTEVHNATRQFLVDGISKQLPRAIMDKIPGKLTDVANRQENLTAVLMNYTTGIMRDDFSRDAALTQLHRLAMDNCTEAGLQNLDEISALAGKPDEMSKWLETKAELYHGWVAASLLVHVELFLAEYCARIVNNNDPLEVATAAEQAIEKAQKIQQSFVDRETNLIPPQPTVPV